MHYLRRRARTLIIAMSSASMLSLTAQAQQSVESFYKGNNINIYVGFSPGGSYDFYARLFARHMGKHIPGNPNVVVQTMPGAGSLRAANYVYNVAPKDGTGLAVVSQTVMLEEPFQTPGVQYKANEFTYIGRMTAVLETMISWHAAKAQNIYDVRKYETVAGGTGSTSPTEGYPRLLNAFAGTKFKIVSGYTGTTDIMLAMERGEVDSLENSWNSIIRTKQEWLDTHKINVLIQASLERTKVLPDTPTLVELGNTPEDKAALAFYTSSAAVSRSILATPGIPPQRVKALRDAFTATTHDPEFLAQVKQSKSEFDPASGEYLQELAKTVAATPKNVVERTANALRAK
jgi:tripartite-type tricarboxylate transporter receptor subunit TctC